MRLGRHFPQNKASRALQTAGLFKGFSRAIALKITQVFLWQAARCPDPGTWNSTFWSCDVPQHISALYAAATMLIKPVARQAWQAQSAQIQGIASNSFEQLGLSWTALSCFQRHSKAFQSPTWSELVLIALLSSAELCHALSCSVKPVGEVSHGNASGDS